MKTENLKWCVGKVGFAAPDTNDTEAAQKALAAHGELEALREVARLCAGALNSRADILDTLEGKRMRIWLTPDGVRALHAAVTKVGAL